MKRGSVLAIDIGTSSTRAAIYDSRGKRVLKTTTQFTYPLATAPDGRAELRPFDIDRAVTKAVSHALRVSGRRGPVAAVGVSCFWHSLLGLDAKGRPITPIYTWADSRCRGDATKLRARGAEKAIHAQTGCMARASFWPAKLFWLRRENPALFRRVARWVSPAEWIQGKWCGQSNASVSMASGTGLLEARTGKWHAGLLRRCGINGGKLNAISDEPLSVSPAAVRKFSALSGTKWFPAIGDGAASNVGSGATAPGFAAINVGTSAALRVVTKAGVRAPFGLFSYRIDKKARPTRRRGQQRR